MNISKIYRKRIIPAECILLKDDIILTQNEEVIITQWNTLHPKTEFSRGCSCFFLQEGIKVSKIYRRDDTLLHWYCDIVEYSFDPADSAMTVTDLLADVVVSPEGLAKVMDLDELAEALERNLITKEQMISCLRSLNHLLSVIYRGNFKRLLSCLDRLGL